VSLSVDAGGVIDRALRWYRRRRAKRVPCGKFVKKIERDYGDRLSNAAREELLARLDDRGLIFRSRSGHCYVLMAPMA
jgi:hypothetical protein